MAPRLEVCGLRRSFGSRCAVESLDLVVEPGEFVALLGPNGAGKSTSFALLSGLLRWDAGSLHVDGLPRDPGDPELRRRLGLVFQAPSLDGLYSARENRTMSGRL